MVYLQQKTSYFRKTTFPPYYSNNHDNYNMCYQLIAKIASRKT